MLITEEAMLTDGLYSDFYNVYPVTVFEKILRDNIEVSKELGDPRSKQGLIDKLDEFITFLGNEISDTRNLEYVTHRILKDDVEDLKCRIGELDSSIDMEKNIQTINRRIEEHLGKLLDIDYEGAQVHVKDRLPGQFRDLGWTMANVRENDPSDLPRGIYLPRTYMSRYMKFLLYHENVHIAIEPDDGDHHYLLWLDEGAADVLSAVYFAEVHGDWKQWVSINMRKHQRTRQGSQIRGWNNRVVALTIMNYGLSGLCSILQARRSNPHKTDWIELYRCISEGRGPEEVEKCLPDTLEFVNGEPTSLQKNVCSVYLSAPAERAVIHPISFVILSEYLQMDNYKGNFSHVSYETLQSRLPRIDSEKIEEYAKNLNGILSIGADNNGMKAWDSVGYFEDTLKFDFVYVDGEKLIKIK